MAQTFYPAYIPSQWIHYTHHKKKRIRKRKNKGVASRSDPADR